MIKLKKWSLAGSSKLFRYNLQQDKKLKLLDKIQFLEVLIFTALRLIVLWRMILLSKENTKEYLLSPMQVSFFRTKLRPFMNNFGKKHHSWQCSKQDQMISTRSVKTIASQRVILPKRLSILHKSRKNSKATSSPTVMSRLKNFIILTISGLFQILDADQYKNKKEL